MADPEANNLEKKSQKVISQLYSKDVPAYLVADHPPLVSDAAKPLIRHIRENNGEALPADAMDHELGVVYRKNEHLHLK